ncbi:RES family NAD+ phosphorylase [Sedimentitalea sp. HM32M-2]|uniref:RES family NAD+ phosphorylase n=1 Tax=Sedimentitalea sp. HM32M-2 TaxID=3351566 RepID=UPI0036396580
MQPDDFPRAEAPPRTHRAIPSRFPPVAAFDTVTSPDDLAAVMELEGWTNDRLVAHRLRRLPPRDWVFGRPNSSVVMAAFLHGSPAGARFSGRDLGAWYCAATAETALIEVLNGLRREVTLSGLTEMTAEYRGYLGRLSGWFVDIRGRADALHNPDSYAAGQVFGEQVRASAQAGISYDSVRDPGGWNLVCYRPPQIRAVTQGAHWRVRIGQTGKVFVETLEQGGG